VIAIIDISIWLTWFALAAVQWAMGVIAGAGEWLWITHVPFLIPVFVMILVWFFGAPFLSLGGVAFGIAGAVQKNRLKTFAIAGIILNTLFVPIKVFLFILGFILGGRLPWDATP